MPRKDMTPEQRARKREGMRERMRQLRATPEGREHMNRLRRESHRRRQLDPEYRAKAYERVRKALKQNPKYAAKKLDTEKNRKRMYREKARLDREYEAFVSRLDSPDMI